jgi:predicted nucleotide-binding protein
MPPPKSQQKPPQHRDEQQQQVKVFLTHGHADAIRESVARFLEKLGLAVIILHEQPGKGRPIIEKFSDYADVSFAVVLLTADDRGGKLTAPKSKLRLRARQNVILELGFFLGRLGQDKVCSLYEDGVELPSNFRGVEYVPLDNLGAWKLKLAKELKAAGINVDLNRAV